MKTKCAKLEDDYKAAAAARDQARKKISTLEEERAQMDEQTALMQKEIEAGKLVAKERDAPSTDGAAPASATCSKRAAKR